MSDSDANIVPFVLKTSNDLVQIGNETRTLKDCIEEKRSEDPLVAKVAYHTIVDNPTPEDMAAFSLDVKHQHGWKSDGGKRPNTHALVTSARAGYVSHTEWETPSTALTWVMKWTTKGFTPVRPIVIATKSITLKPKHFHQVTGAADPVQ